ncbi:MAG TPA: hypothetical protein VMF06_06775 [Candidatus Limnocylindria bacterium]|jgi:hypothetical protein|nr:hypothetical protein [Candidatus Limnocylindria bacterium]
MDETKEPGNHLGMVYNAESGFFNAVSDSVHKLVSPSTYACSLCRMTYGLTTMVRPWKQYLESLPMPVVFLYRADFSALYPKEQQPLPLIFWVQEGRFEILLGANEINACQSVQALMDRLDRGLTRRGLRSGSPKHAPK